MTASLLAALAMVLALCGPAQALSRFDGIADQNFGAAGGPWPAPVADNANNNESLAGVFQDAWVGSGHIKYARLITAWDAATQGGACLDTVKRFYVYALQHHLTPVVSVWNSYSPGCSNSSAPANAGTYSVALSSLIGALATASGTNTAPTVIEAWNEPNLTLSGNPGLAAQLWVKANDLCNGGCTAVAGDFADSRNVPSAGCASASYSTVRAYEQSYLDYFTSHAIAAPKQWGFHPYNSGLCHTATPVNDLNAVLAGVSGHQLWYTEAGAYRCQPSSGQYRSAAEQNSDAMYLNALLDPSFNVVHAFYYGLAQQAASPIGTPGTCAPGAPQDSVLYDGDVNDGHFRARPAARTIFGSSVLAATTDSSSTPPDHQGVTVGGTVNPGGVTDASYHVEWGRTSSYGNRTPDVPVGPGGTPIAVSATLTGLMVGKTYHFRFVATNGIDADGVGSDQTFLSPQATHFGQPLYYWSDYDFWGDATAQHLVGDFNGDNKDDLVAWKTNGQTAVELSTGDHFGPPLYYWSDYGFFGNGQNAVGDFNGDGKDDLVAWNTNGQTAVELSTGDHFGQPLYYWSDYDFWGDANAQHAVGDFNGDGKDDLVAWKTNGQTAVELSTGNHFGPPLYYWSDYDFWGDPSGKHAVGDFNGDGKDDLVAWKTNGQTAVELSTGDHFGQPLYYWSDYDFWGDSTAQHLVGDFTGGGKDDLVTWKTNGQTAVEQSTGDHFGPPLTYWSDYGFFGNGQNLAGDFNGDGAADLVAWNTNGQTAVEMAAP